MQSVYWSVIFISMILQVALTDSSAKMICLIIQALIIASLFLIFQIARWSLFNWIR